MEKVKIKELADYLNCTVQNLYYMKKNDFKKFELLVEGYKWINTKKYTLKN